MQVKVFTIPVFWVVSAKLEIQTDTLEKAIEIAYDADIDMLDSEYVDESFEVDLGQAKSLNEDL